MIARSSSGERSWGSSKRRSSLTAGSPFRSAFRSQGDVPVLASGDGLALGREHPERLDQARPGLGGFDHVVDEPAFGRDVRRRELVLILLDQLGARRGRVLGLLDLIA